MTILLYVQFLWAGLLSFLFQIHVSVVIFFGVPFVFSIREIFNVVDVTIRFSINIKSMIRNIEVPSSYSVVPLFHKPSSRFVMYTISCCSGSSIPNVDPSPSLSQLNSSIEIFSRLPVMSLFFLRFDDFVHHLLWFLAMFIFRQTLCGLPTHHR